MSTRVLAAAALLGAASVAAADPIQDALHACAAQKDHAERLACYDRVSAAVDALVAAPSAGARPASPAAPTAAAGVASTGAAAPAPIPPTPIAAAGASTPPAAPASMAARAAPAPAAPSAAPSPAPVQAAASTSPQTDPNFGLDAEALRHKRQDHGEAAAPRPKPQPLVVRVAKVQTHGPAEMILELENGQVWKQTDGVTGVLVSANDTVTITPGALGGFLLTSANRRVVRVKRIL